MRLFLLSILILLSTIIQAQNVGVATNDGDTLFIRGDMYKLIVQSWDNVINEPIPTLICVENLIEKQNYIIECEKKRIRAEKMDRWFDSKRRYFLFFTIPLN